MDSGPSDHRGEHIDSLIDEYLKRRRSGEQLTPEQFAAQYPNLGEELVPYLKGLSLLDKIIPPGKREVSSQAARAANAELFAIAGYELLEEIGRGGMGVVYKARQRSTKRVVALKVISAGAFASESARRRFDREVRLTARLQHAGIVRVLDGGQIAGQKYCAMDLVDGVPLDTCLSQTQLDLRAKLAIFERISEAVHYAHTHGVIHRDLKPANILVDKEGNPHILDFGLGRAAGRDEEATADVVSVSVPGQVLGTLFYLSPEQAAGDPDEIDARTDVYAVGVMLFEALTGSPPIDRSGSTAEVLQRILIVPPARPSSVTTSVDSEIETVILKALERDKNDRYQSAKELGEDIRRYLDGEPILARRPSSFYFLRKKALKHRWAVMTGAFFVALLLVGLATEVRSRHLDMAHARRAAVESLQQLEAGDVSLAFQRGEALSDKYGPRLPEAILVCAHAQYLTPHLRPGAVRQLKDALQRWPSLWACRMMLAEIYLGAGDTDGARVLHEQAERDAPDTAEAWYLRSFATLDRQRALRCVEEAIKRDPSHVLAWRRLTLACLDAGDFDGVFRGADKLILLGENPAYWHSMKGQLLHRQGRFREALEEYAYVLGPLVHRAHVYRCLGEYEESVAEYTKVVEAKANIWVVYQRATPLWILGRHEEALEDYRRVRSALGKPTFGDARRYLILRELGREQEALEVLEDAPRDVTPDDRWLAYVFRCLADRITPDELIAEAITLNDPEHICEAYYYAAETCLLRGDRDSARKRFQQCVQTGLRLDPDSDLTTPMNEFELAQWRLDTLFAETGTPPNDED